MIMADEDWALKEEEPLKGFTHTCFIPKSNDGVRKRLEKDLQQPERQKLSKDTRYTNVGPVNPKLYGENLKLIEKSSELNIKESLWKMKLERLSDSLTELNAQREDDHDDTISIQPGPSARWHSRNMISVDPGVLNNSKKDYFSLYDTDFTEMAPQKNGYCYLCTTQEEHKAHMKTIRKIHGVPRKQYYNPVKPSVRPRTAIENKKTNEIKGEKVIYKVVVKTGNKVNAGTDAQIHIQMFGQSKSHKTEKIHLRKPAANFQFLRDSKTTFSITTVDVGELSALKIEHDGREKNQSWFLESVEITNMKSKVSWYFPCEDWLSLYHKDETLCRILEPEQRQSIIREYQVSVVTGGMKHSGTDSKVYLTLIGSKCRSRKVNLHNKGEHSFTKGAVNTFQIKAEDIGGLQKIRIEHDNRGKSRRWLLIVVLVKDLYANRQHLFFCNQWLIDEEDNAVWREIPSSAVPKGFDLSSLGGKKENEGDVLYEVSIYTGDVALAGTDAGVYMQLIGDKLSSKLIQLSEMRGNHDDPFERNQSDIYQLKSVNVGDLSKIRIGHDNKGMAAGWFLEKVLVRKFVDIRERVKISKDNKDREELQDEISNQSEEGETSSDVGIIGRNKTKRSASGVSLKGKQIREKESKDEESELRTTSKFKLTSKREELEMSSDESNENSDSEESDDELQSASQLNLRRKKKLQEMSKRFELSDVTEEGTSDTLSAVSQEETATGDKLIQEALRLKKEHDLLNDTMEKVIPQVEEYTFECKQWFAEGEGDGKIERILRCTNKKVYNRSDDK